MTTHKRLLALAVGAVMAAPVASIHAEQQGATVTASPRVLDRISITGGADRIQDVPGSAQTLGREDLEKQNYDDPMRVMRQVPGVYVTEEEGQGLFPNISIRGARQERNNRITVMEDGVLIAPAPYSAPAAYYFPNIQRMDQVEVRKGSSSIEYGPYTIGGAINMLSTPIPNEQEGQLTIQGGERSEYRLHGWFGDSSDQFGYLVETYQRGADGFRRLDTPQASGNRPGYDNQNYLAKFRVNTAPEAERYQELEVKLGKDEKSADETYLGLTMEDYRDSPFRRYAGSAQDEINTGHEQVQLRHFMELTPEADLTTTAYHNEFARNWYKLDSVNGDGISAILANPDDHSDELDWIRGNTEGDNGLTGNVRANNREYFSRGVESQLNWRFDTASVSHALKAGVRVHQDEEDRFQWEDEYRMENNNMVLASRGEAGSQTNRVTRSNATALFVQNRMDFGRLAVTPGLRYEHIRIKRTDYQDGSDPDRGVVTDTSRGEYNELIPGVGATYQVTDAFQVLGGVYRGFAPTGPNDSDAEEAINFEAGFRYQQPHFRSEVIGFYNDYENLSGTCTASSGGGCEIGDTFSAGNVEVYGVEALALYDAGRANGLSFGIPLTAAYTWTQSTFRESFDSDFGDWGEVHSGDELPGLPEHQLSLGAGIEKGRYGVNLRANYVSVTRASAGSGAIPASERIDSRWTLDLSANYQVSDHVNLFASVENLTDETYIANQRPAGVRVGAPRTFLAGARVRF